MNGNDDLFEAFLKRTLHSDQRAAFETRVRDDAGFAREFEEFNTLYDLVKLAGEHRLKAKLSSIHEATSRGRPQVIRMRPLVWLAIAASALLAFGATWFFLDRPADPQELYSEYITPYPGPDRTRSGDTDDPWRRFAEAYDDGRFDEAHSALDRVPTDLVPDYLVSFYRGQCLLLRKAPDPRAAMRALEDVLATDNDLHPIARWYLGLAALKAADAATARTHFEVLERAGGYRSKEAARILEQLGDP